MSTVTRESPMQHDLEHLRPVRWGELRDMRVAMEIAGSQEERQRLAAVALCDASALPRIGLKGPGCGNWLSKHNLKIPPAIYGVEPLAGEGMLIRTGTHEFFLEDGPAGDTVAQLTEALALNVPEVYPVWRADAAMVLRGPKSNEVMLETCGVDFTQPQSGLVYSRVAGVSCAILKQEIDGAPTFRLWCDGSFGSYLWDTLLEIVRSIGGDAVGIASCFPTAR